MTLLALLLGLALERLVAQLLHLREPRWFDRYFDWGSVHIGGRRGPGVSLVAILLCLLPVTPVVALAVLTGDRLLGLPYVLFASVVLVFSLGPRDLKDEVDDYCNALARGDTAQAAERAKALLEDDASSRDGPTREVVEEAILTQSNNRIFAVIFWFMVLGPSGAWLFRVTDLMRRRAVFESRRHAPGDQPAPEFLIALQTIHGALSWVPARLTALFFALAGSFEDAVGGWRNYVATASGEFFEANDHVLVCVGKGAIGPVRTPEGMAPELASARAAMRLVLRTLLIWLVLLSALTLAGWLV